MYWYMLLIIISEKNIVLIFDFDYALYYSYLLFLCCFSISVYAYEMHMLYKVSIFSKSYTTLLRLVLIFFEYIWSLVLILYFCTLHIDFKTEQLRSSRASIKDLLAFQSLAVILFMVALDLISVYVY